MRLCYHSFVSLSYFVLVFLQTCGCAVFGRLASSVTPWKAFTWCLAVVSMLLVVRWAFIIDDVFKLAAENSVYSATAGFFWQAGASVASLGDFLFENFVKSPEPKPPKVVMAKPIAVMRRQNQNVLASFLRSEFFVATARLVCDGAFSRLR